MVWFWLRLVWDCRPFPAASLRLPPERFSISHEVGCHCQQSDFSRIFSSYRNPPGYTPTAQIWDSIAFYEVYSGQAATLFFSVFLTTALQLATLRAHGALSSLALLVLCSTRIFSRQSPLPDPHPLQGKFASWDSGTNLPHGGIKNFREVMVGRCAKGPQGRKIERVRVVAVVFHPMLASRSTLPASLMAV